MFKAISSALSLLLILLVLKGVFPEIAKLLSDIIIKALEVLSILMDRATTLVQL